MRSLLLRRPLDGLSDRLTALRTNVAGVEPRRLIRDLRDAFRKHELLLYANAISFRVFASIIPLLLFAVGMLGFLSLDEVWRDDIAPDIRPDVSKAAFEVIDDTITKVLEHKRLFWITLGAGIAVWQMSGAMRMTMKASNRIFELRETRTVAVCVATSIALGIVAAVLILSAVAMIKFGPLFVEATLGHGTLLGVVAFIVQWLIGVALLLLLIGLVVRFAPAKRQPIEWVSFGALVVVVAWILMSLVFGFYLTSIASYGSLFGNLATVIVALEYVFLSSIVFVAGLQIEAQTRREVER
jgi:membrane protein